MTSVELRMSNIGSAICHLSLATRRSTFVTRHSLFNGCDMTKTKPSDASIRQRPACLVGSGSEIALTGRTVTRLGRAPDNDVVLDNKRSSRYHAEIRWEKHHYVLHDMDSTNGTFVNGERLVAPHVLKDGDRIEIAGIGYRFSDPEATIIEERLPTLVVEEGTGLAWVNRHPLVLSAKEFALLALLYRRAGAVCDKDSIASAVWPECPDQVYDYQIENLVGRLRQKLEAEPGAGSLIENVRGRGYRLLVPG
jgi:hypothetical protein